MIKYIGSKRTLVGVLGAIASAVEATDAVDLFTGTTRVAQEFKRRGIATTAADTATYSEVLARCFVETDATAVDAQALRDVLAELEALPPNPGYFTRTFCEASRYFQPGNGARVDAIRDRIAEAYAGTWLEPLLLTSLMMAADRVDSTTGVQMAYLKQWAPRAHKPLELRVPALLPGAGTALRGDAHELAASLPRADLIYIDPPYNQHRYFANYHIWETLVRWDAPEHRGVACKRVDTSATRSVFNSKRTMPGALRSLIHSLRAEVVVASYNDEGWVTPDELTGWLREAGHEEVRLFAYDSRRYVGAQIGVFGPSGTKVGTVSHLRNTEYVFVAGPTARVEAAAAAASTPLAPRGATARVGAGTASAATVLHP